MNIEPGNTPLIEAKILAKFLGIEKLFFKDESKNPSGSFKDRASKVQFANYSREGKNHFSISSSGNAAISTALFAKNLGFYLDIFLPESIPAYKLERLKNIVGDYEKILMHFSKVPKKDFINFTRENNLTSLLASKDDNAIIGYESLGKELERDVPNIFEYCIFMPASSGTGILGMNKGISSNPKIFAVQTTKIYPIAKEFDTDFVSTQTSIANAISSNYVPRKAEVVEMLKRSNGGGLVISDEEIENALNLAKEYENINISKDSALSLAGLIKALKKNIDAKKAICILTGI